MWLSQKLNWQTRFLDNLLNHLRSWPKHVSARVYSNLWKIAPSILLWELLRIEGFSVMKGWNYQTFTISWRHAL